MSEQASRSERVNRFAQAIAMQIDLPHVLAEAIGRARELCDADGACLILVDRQTGELRFDTLSGTNSGPLQRIRLRPGQGIAGKVALEAKSQLALDAQNDSAFEPSCDAATGFKTGSIIAVPLINGGDVLGVLQAVRRQGREPFTEVDLGQLEQLAPHVTIAVRNSQMRDDLREMHAQVVAANAELEAKIDERTRQLARAKSEWEKTFDTISEPIALQDGYVIRRANLEYAKRTGIDIRQLPGQLCYKLLAHRDSPCPSCPLLQGRDGTLRAEIVDRNRSILQFSGFWASEAPSDSGVVVHYRDITKERQLAERLRETERLASLGQLASGAAHEINNPIGFVLSNLQSLRSHLDHFDGLEAAISNAIAALKAKDLAGASRALQGVEEEELREALRDQREMVDESIEGAQRVSRIVRALRELARQEVDVTEPACVNASVTRVARADCADQAPIALDLKAEGQAQISPLQLDHALEQVVRNARQASGDSRRICLRTRSTPTQMIIEVEDRGAGIAPEHRRRIFEPFFTTRPIGQGVGLGLTVAYGIVTRSGGTIAVDSELGRGTLVTLTLPRAGAPDGPEMAPGQRALGVSQPHLN